MTASVLLSRCGKASRTTRSASMMVSIAQGSHVSSHIKMMHLSDPTCYLFGEVGITLGMLECHHNLALFNIYGVPVFKVIPFIDIQVD